MREVVFVLVRSDDGRVYGGEKSTLATASALAARGWRPRFVVTADDDVTAELDELAIPWEVVPVRDPFAGLRRASWRGRLGRLRDVVKVNAAVWRAARGRARIVHAIATTGFFSAFLGGRLAGARVVYHVRGASRGQRTQPLEEAAVLLADRTVAVSRALRDQLVGTGRRLLRPLLARRVGVVANGFDFAAIDRAAGPPAPARQLTDFHVLFVGSISRDKGQLRFLERVWPRVLAEVPQARLTLIGEPRDPSYGGAVRAAAGPGVAFAGYLPQAEVYRRYRAADVLVLPSEREGLPRCAIEAHALGLPVVATDVVGVAEVVGSDSGFVVPDDRLEEMAAPLVRLARDPGLRARLGAAGAARVRARFSIEANAEAIDALYRELGA